MGLKVWSDLLYALARGRVVAKKTHCEIAGTGIDVPCKQLKALDRLARAQALSDALENADCQPFMPYYPVGVNGRHEPVLNLSEEIVAAPRACKPGFVDLGDLATQNVGLLLGDFPSLQEAVEGVESPDLVLTALAALYKESYTDEVQSLLNSRVNAYNTAAAKVAGMVAPGSDDVMAQFAAADELISPENLPMRDVLNLSERELVAHLVALARLRLDDRIIQIRQEDPALPLSTILGIVVENAVENAEDAGNFVGRGIDRVYRGPVAVAQANEGKYYAYRMGRGPESEAARLQQYRGT